MGRYKAPPAPAQRLVEAALHGDLTAVLSEMENADVGINDVAAVSLRVRCSEVVLREEAPDKVSTDWTELRTEITALFAASHSGHVDVVRTLLQSGADANRKLFRGYATTAAACQGNIEILDLILKSGASEDSVESALIESSLLGQTEAVELLILSEKVGPTAAAHAIVTASSRGFTDVVAALIKSGVDVNCMDRVLLQSVKPNLHANVDCTPLIAAIISRQISTVKYLLEAGASTNSLVRVGSWSWDAVTGEELRVGACLGEPYNAAWCAVEYYELTGQTLTLILKRNPRLLDAPHLGRTLLCHAIQCQIPSALSLLLSFGANPRFPIHTTRREFFPIHLAARLASSEIVRVLISHPGADSNARDSNGDTPLMVSARAGRVDSFLELVKAGADLGLVNNLGQSAVDLASKFAFGPSSLAEIITKAVDSGTRVKSSNTDVFSPLHFMAKNGRAGPLQTLILHSSTDELNQRDRLGFTPLMSAARAGRTNNFRLLVMAGTDIKATDPKGESVISFIKSMDPFTRDSFEQVLLSAVLANVITDNTIFNALHYAAKNGDNSSVIQLIKMGFDVNSLDEGGYSPLMRAAMGGNSRTCKILLSQGGADGNLINSRNESAIALASKSTECVLLDSVAKNRVLQGENLVKYTRGGRGPRHARFVRMLRSGVLSWGKTKKRNVGVKEVRLGHGLRFWKGRPGEGETGIFHVVTEDGREIHFEAGSVDSSEVWVRGVNLVVKESGLF